MADARNRRYILKHADIPVADIELEYGTGAISAIGPVYNERHVPVGIPVKKGRIDRAALNGWWRGRAIPDSRDGIKESEAFVNPAAPGPQLGSQPVRFLLDLSLA